MIELKSSTDLAKLRRIVLRKQGLLHAKPFGTGLRGAIDAMNHLGYVQIDTISVVERAHHHVLYSRVPKFNVEMTNEMLVAGDIFEYWAHAASFLPIQDFRFSLPYKQAIKSGKTHWYKTPDRNLMHELLERVKSEGPLRARDLESDRLKGAGWWDWKPAKKALEQLYMQGDLMVRDREGFQKRYDLTERVLPPSIDISMPSIDELAEYLYVQQLRSFGVISLKGVTYLRRDTELRKAVKTLVEEQFSLRYIDKVKLENGDVFFVEAGALENRIPRVHDRLLILSPFDNCVIQRDRLSSLFKFDYQIECYVPEAKRKYGYFSLPLLFRDMFIGRMDCKNHRKERRLEVKSLHFEEHSFDLEKVIDAFSKSLQEFCLFQKCESVSVGLVNPKRLKSKLRKALKEINL